MSTYYKIIFSRPTDRDDDQDGYELFDTVVEGRTVARNTRKARFGDLVPDEVHAYAQYYGRVNCATEYWVYLWTPTVIGRSVIDTSAPGYPRGYRVVTGGMDCATRDDAIAIHEPLTREQV